MAEEWLPVSGYEGIYEISTLGNVKSVGRVVPFRWFSRTINERILSYRVDSSGHAQVGLCVDGVEKMHLVHRLVLEAFTGECPDGMECCHNDGDPSNNRIDNLRWDTHAGNMGDTVNHGTHNRGEKCGMSKLSEFGVRVIRRLLESTSMTHAEIGSVFGVHKNTIGGISNGTRWGWMNESATSK
jgi:hypothetical protein